jgi:hypothetical protein
LEPDAEVLHALSQLFRYRDWGNHAEGDRGVVRYELRATLVTCRPLVEQLDLAALELLFRKLVLDVGHR